MQDGLTNGEAILANNESRNNGGRSTRRRCSNWSRIARHFVRCRVAVDLRGRIEWTQFADDVERDDGDVRLVNTQNFLIARACRVVGDANALRGDCEDVRHGHIERLDRKAEFAGHVDVHVAAQQAKDIHGDIEGATDSEQVRRDAAAGLLGVARLGRSGLSRSRRCRRIAPECERTAIDPDCDGDDEFTVLESELVDANCRALQRERSDLDRSTFHRSGLRRGINGETFLLRRVHCAGGGAESCEVQRAQWIRIR